MESFFTSNKGKIHFKVLGRGSCIVLLHGYLENLDIWNGFAEELSLQYQVLILDIPQHGKSECYQEVNSIERMAECVHATLDHLKISKALIVGHSMGGYVALAFAELFPNSTAGLCLLHSTPNADSEEKKRNRIQEIDQVRKGRKGLIVEYGIPLRFAEKNLSTLKGEVEWTKKIALATADIGVIGALKAMASRIDRNQVFANATFPTQMIFGAMDGLIPARVIEEMISKHKKTRIAILNNSGHMGFIEERDQALNEINSFLAVVFS